jgi:phosphopantothenoylcysteine decarboxylase / phosphopantothenate---cysteine ligase
MSLRYRRILLGVSGGIAAYKAAHLVRLLIKQGHDVQVVMTAGAKRFITPLTFQALTGKPVRDELWDDQAEASMGHIELARWADLILIAPATAQVIASLAHGFAYDLLSTLCLASKAPVWLAPSMNQQMWHSKPVSDNIKICEQRGVMLLGPQAGEQACGDVGLGRMMEPELIAQACQFSHEILRDKRILITAGPTQEAIDPIRFLTNRSSGRMGYALACAARDLGAEVVLVSGPVNLEPPHGINTIQVKTAREMHQAVMPRIDSVDWFIASAAVSDYCVAEPALQKIKKQSGSLQLQLARTPDILADVIALQLPVVTVGFAAETEQVIEKAKQKKQRKGCDFIIANDVSGDQVMGQCNAAASLLSDTKRVDFALQSKATLAKQCLVSIYKQLQCVEKV